MKHSNGIERRRSQKKCRKSHKLEKKRSLTNQKTNVERNNAHKQ